MKILKALVVGLLLSAVCVWVLELFHIRGVQLSRLYYWLIVAFFFIVGGYAARHVSWRWLLGGLSGALSGFYSALLLRACFWSASSYEEGLGALLLAAGVGLVAGGAILSRLSKARSNHDDVDLDVHN